MNVSYLGGVSKQKRRGVPILLSTTVLLEFQAYTTNTRIIENSGRTISDLNHS